MKPINTSFYDFDRIVEGGYVYVDKTAILYEVRTSLCPHVRRRQDRAMDLNRRFSAA